MNNPPVRFYERVRSSKLGKALRDFYGNPDQPPVVIDVQNVAEYFWAQRDDHKNFETKDFPNVALPFEQFWLEYQRGKGEWYGLAVVGRELDPEDVVRDGIQWELSVSMFCSTKRGDIFPCSHATAFVKPGGAIENEMDFVHDEYLRGLMIKKIIELGADDRPDEIADALAIVDFQPFWLAISFLHCKNVLMINHEPPKLSRAAASKGVKPRVRFHTLEIEPMKKILRREGQSETTGLKKALHICRGHFADYSKGEGLFGKYKGTYWREAHLRGTADEGVVVKQYSVKAKAEERA